METFFGHFLVESKGILSQLSKMVQHLYFCWRNKGSRVPKIFNIFSIKIQGFFWFTQKVTFFTNSNVFLSNNSNNPSTRFSCFFLKRGTAKLLFICDRSPKMDPSGRIDPKFCIHCAFGMLIPKICIWRLSCLLPPFIILSPFGGYT